MAKQLPPYKLGMTEDQAQEQFNNLQLRLVPLWKSICEFTDDEQTIVVVPSLSVDMELTAAEQQAYEERFLFILLLLRQANARMVYVTSQPIQPGIIEYYLDMLPGMLISHARRRLTLLSPNDGSPGPLTDKLLRRPRLLEQIRNEVKDPHRAHLVPFNTTTLERDLAIELGIPMYGADPKHLWMGTKSGCRQIFREQNVAHPLGHEGLASESEVVNALAEMLARKPNLQKVIIKQNEGVSGQGNAVIDLSAVTDAKDHNAIATCLGDMKCELATLDASGFLQGFTAGGGIVEEFIHGTEIRSPSVQVRITPLGQCEILSTHDQLLGGPSGQSFLGCVFPADSAYATLIAREAEKVTKRLANEGVLGRFAIDFLVSKQPDGSWLPYAIELNLRKGGTTHPFLTLQFLTDGSYDPEVGEFRTAQGEPKFFVATDYLKSSSYRVFTADDAINLIVDQQLHFDETNHTGVVLHMLSSLGETGRCGFTAVANSPEQATALYQRVIEVFDNAAKKSGS